VPNFADCAIKGGDRTVSSIHAATRPRLACRRLAHLGVLAGNSCDGAGNSYLLNGGLLTRHCARYSWMVGRGSSNWWSLPPASGGPGKGERCRVSEIIAETQFRWRGIGETVRSFIPRRVLLPLEYTRASTCPRTSREGPSRQRKTSAGCNPTALCCAVGALHDTRAGVIEAIARVSIPTSQWKCRHSRSASVCSTT
jgi:hypothetical protein